MQNCTRFSTSRPEQRGNAGRRGIQRNVGVAGDRPECAIVLLEDVLGALDCVRRSGAADAGDASAGCEPRGSANRLSYEPPPVAAVDEGPVGTGVDDEVDDCLFRGELAAGR